MEHAFPRKAVFGLVSLVVCSVSTTLFAQVPEGFELVTLWESSGNLSVPRINNRSEVVWSEALGPTDGNVYKYSGGSIARITDDRFHDKFPVLNNLGAVAWNRAPNWDGPFKVVLLDGGEPVEIPNVPTILGAGDINDAGYIVWSHLQPVGIEPAELILHDGKTARQITENGLSNFSARINGRGDVVWTRYDFSVSPWTATIMLYREGVTYELTDGTGEPQGPDINDLGQVVWDCGYGCETLGIHLWEDGQVTLVTDNPSSQNPVINNLGDVAFNRFQQVNQTWQVWLHSDGEFFQLTNCDEWNAAPAINDAGEIVWGNVNFKKGLDRIRMLRASEQHLTSTCTSDPECNDGDVCTQDLCQCALCSHTSTIYGDVNLDGDVDVLDILCVLDGFRGEFTNCTMTRLDIGRCVPDGFIDLSDILGVLDAFAGQGGCCP